MSTLADLFKPALRMAGITKLAGVTPSTDQYTELIPAFNRMVASWNIARLNIYTIRIDRYTLTAGQKAYTIGPGGDFDTTRPIRIEQALIVLTTSTPEIRLEPLWLMTDEDWSHVTLQDVPNTIPSALYNDGAYPLSTLYLWGQAAAAYDLELYTWQALTDTNTAVTDAVIVPPGYEEALVLNFAVRVASLYPRDSVLDPQVRRDAQKALGLIQSLNAPRLRMISDAAGLTGSGGSSQIVMGGGGGSSSMSRIVISGSINGTNGSDGNATFTLASVPSTLYLFKNGILQTPGTSYTLSGSTITFLAPNIPITGDTLTAAG